MLGIEAFFFLLSYAIVYTIGNVCFSSCKTYHARNMHYACAFFFVYIHVHVHTSHIFIWILWAFFLYPWLFSTFNSVIQWIIYTHKNAHQTATNEKLKRAKKKYSHKIIFLTLRRLFVFALFHYLQRFFFHFISYSLIVFDRPICSSSIGRARAHIH